MLVRDIKLEDAITDLVDNCVDGARRLRSSSDFAGLSVRATVSPEKFVIVDNCGGIPLDTALNYAFCFGRPENAVGVEHSIGRFGVGMKRAFFKMGQRFSVETFSGEDHYQVSADVREWRRDPSDWHFPFRRLPPLPSGAERGTTIEVGNLHEEVVAEFSDSGFARRLARTLAREHHFALQSGLGITVNMDPVQVSPIEVLRSDQLEPAVSLFTMELRRPVGVKVVAGLGESSPKDAGWYLYCNGRMVAGADTTEMTGWQGLGGGRLPKFHNQYAEFRGFVFMDSDDTDLLPWRTTKSGVDVDSIVYRRVLQEMTDLGRPIISFLNQKKEEAESAKEEEQLLGHAVATAGPVRVETLNARQPFKAPEPEFEPLPEEARVRYYVPVDRLNRVKAKLRVRKNEDVGRRTFDYYFVNEVEGE